MKLESLAFKNNDKIPNIYTCDAIGINPPLNFSDIPRGAKSLAILMDDPDIPDSVKESLNIKVWDHWVLFNISPETRTIEENTVPIGIFGRNTSGNNKYGPPCPPYGEHRYFFKLYALDKILNLPTGVSKEDVLKGMAGHILDEAELVGRYQRI